MNRPVFLRIAAMFLVFIVTSSAHAVQSYYLHQTYMSARIMAMGGAYTAVADDYNTLYLNPAGLARLKEGQINLYVQPMGTPNILTFSSDLKNAGSDPTTLQNTLQNYYGTHLASRVGWGGVWVRPSWGIGISPLDLTVEADIHGTAGTTVGVQAYQDSLVQFGYALNFGENDSLSIGLAAKAVYRGYFEKDLTIFDLVNSRDLFRASDAQEGMTGDIDLGVLYTVQVPEEGWLSWMKYARPTLGFTVRNVADIGFKSNFHLYGGPNSVTPEGRLERRFDVGTNWELPEFWVFKPHVMVDFRDMGTRYASFKKSMHFGAELLWKAFGWLNGSYAVGLSQGYLTAGIGLQSWIFRLDIATYSEEIGTTDSPKDNRRYIARLSLDF